MLNSFSFVGVLELGSAWMLGWLAAAGIPLALHLLHRRRQQELSWAAIELLMQAIRQNSRTVRIEQWLLLLLRTCALILFAVALARPLMRANSGVETVTTEPPKLWIIVMDVSYSMGYTSQRESLWQTAQRRATTLVRSASTTDAFALIQLAEPSRAVIGQPTFDSARVIEVIERLKCGDEGGDLASCLEVIQQTIDNAKQLATEQSNVHILFFSDMGRDSWQAAVTGADRRKLQELAAHHQLRIESLAPDAVTNVAITAFDVESAMILQGRALRCSATVHNFGSGDIERLPLQFQSAGSTLHTEFVACPAGQSRTVEAELQPPLARSWHISAQLPADNLTIDNRRDLVISIRPQINVVTIEQSLGDARLINLSLAPHATPIGSPVAVSVDTWNTIDFQSRSLGEVDAVVLVDLPELSGAMLTKLRNFVEAGGALLYLVGPSAQAASWNRADSTGQLLGFNLAEPSAQGDWRIDPLNYSSPIAKPFANFLDAGLLTTPIFRYWKIAPHESVDLIRDLGVTGGDAWIVRRSFGAGWTAAMLSAPESGAQLGDGSTPSWNAIATWPSFVPIMQKLVETLIGGSEQQVNLNVGQPLRGQVTQAARPHELSVRRPDNTTSRVALAAPAAAERQTWSYANTDRAGVYQVSVSDQAEADPPQQFAVNIIPNQSDLQPIDPAALPLSSDPQTAAQPRPSAVSGLDTAEVESISRACLVALLAVLGCESLLAWHLGRRLT